MSGQEARSAAQGHSETCELLTVESSIKCTCGHREAWMAAHDQVQREVASVMKALAPMGGTKEQSDACIALGRLAAWAEAGLSRV